MFGAPLWLEPKAQSLKDASWQARDISVVTTNVKRRFGEHGLCGQNHRPRVGKKPIYDKGYKNNRILALVVQTSLRAMPTARC